MNGPGGAPRQGGPFRRRNFTALQLLVFLGTGLVALAALLAAGLSTGLAVAGAAMIAALALALWVVIANLYRRKP